MELTDSAFADRTVLITGASSGLGAHFARLFSKAGAKVVLGARRVDRVGELAASLGKRAMPVAMDVTVESSVRAAFDAADERFGLVDVIIANAGINAPGRATELPESDVRSLLETNVLGVYLTAREGARRLIAGGSRQTGRGRIIFVGSITAHLTGQGDSAYCAAKAGVAHLGRNLAREWIRQGINVNTVQPGYIATELSGDWFDTDEGNAQVAGFHRRRIQPLEALDGMMLYLASDASAWTTGAVIDVDDGQSL